MECTESNLGFQARENVSTRRSRKVKNLEKEVEMILSQDESEDEAIPNPSYEPQLPKTPTTTRRRAKSAAGVMCTPRASEAVLQDMLQTPRRSCRKSIKPPQDYDDIVRQSTRSAKKRLTSLGEEVPNEENELVLCPVSEDGINVGEQTKWSTANVGRSSTKRSTRKSKRGTRGKRNLNEETKMEDENVHIPSNKNEEMFETVQIDVDVNATIGESKNPVVNSPTKQNNEMVVINEQKLSEVNKIQETPESESSVKAANALEYPDEQKVRLMLDEVKATRETMEVDEQEKTEEIRLIQEDEDTNADNIKSITEQNNVIVLDDEHVEEEIHLLQEDTEDCKEFPSVSNNSPTSFTLNQNENKDSINAMAEKDTCLNSPKVEGRNKLSKLEIDTSKTTLQSNEKDAKDYFGCYLKSKEIDIEDLGLNPLNDDEDEKKLNEVQLLPSVAQQDINEEMPSLIVCDDEEENVLEQPEEQKTKLNVTFDADDSVVVVSMDENTSHSVHSEMDVLQMSEDEECQGSAKKVPRIMLTTTEEQNQTLLSTPPQQKKKPYRHPTPYRNRSDSKVKKEINTGSAKKLPMSRENLNSSAAGFTTMTPREIVLRGIRKRSMSVCLGADEFSKQRSRLTRSAKKTLQKAVNFYSPANQTTIIDDLDKLIEKSVKKNAKQISEINKNKNVTTRRKRSLSADDNLSKSMFVASRLPRPMMNQSQFLNNTVTTTTSSSTSTSSSKLTRTKLPNFAAIHQKQFQKMENLADHVARKQERSKVLINSTSKIRPASAQKNVIANVKNNPNEKPKALKKIDLTAQISQAAKIVPTNATAVTTAPRKIISTQDKKAPENKLAPILPDPRNAKIVKPVYPRSHLKPTQSFNFSSITAPKSRTNTVPKQKPAFNLSTQLSNTLSTNKSTSSSANTSNIENKMVSTQDKMAARLQRHMDLFKGRVPAARAGVASRKNEAAIKGVRSNRRFELQMKHRKNAEN